MPDLYPPGVCPPPAPDPAGAAAGRNVTRRGLLASASVAGLGLVLEACAGGKPAGHAAQTASTVTVPVMQWANVTVATTTRQIVSEFEKAYPNIRISLQIEPTTNFYSKLETLFAAGTPPGLTFMDPATVLHYASAGALTDLEPLIAKDNYDISDYFAAAVQEYQFKGGLYGLSRGFGNQDIYYNIDLLDKAHLTPPPTSWTAGGWTFADYLTMAQRLTVRDSSGRTRQWGCYVDSGTRGWFPWVWNNGGHILNATRTKSVMSGTATVAALQFLQDLIYRYKVAPTPADLSSEDAAQQFASGIMAMFEDIPADVGFLRQSIGTRFAWGVAPMPKGPGGRYTSGGGIAYALPRAFPHQEEAWTVLKYLNSKAAMTQLTLTGGVFPPRKSVADSPQYLQQAKYPLHMEVFVQAPAVVREDPLTIYWPQINNVWTQQLGSLWDGTTPAKQVCATIDEQVNAILSGA